MLDGVQLGWWEAVSHMEGTEMCRCRDTGAKVCKWEHPTDTWTLHLKAQVQLERKSSRIQLHRWMDETDGDDGPVLAYEPHCVFSDLPDHTECTCRRCLLHDDPSGCLVRFPPVPVITDPNG